MKRAYSIIEVKAVSEEERTIEGIATTPTPDRVGDVVEPEGASYKLPLPLLWQHNSDKPVGFVEEASVTSKGISFKARIVKIAEPGALKDMVDYAWQCLKAKLVRGVSIGFNASEVAFLRDTGGIHFLEWEWLELSLVTIPANSEATIARIKSCDKEQMAASGRSLQVSSAASGKTVKLNLRGNSMTKKSVADQIADWEETRRTKSAEMTALMEASEAGETLDADQQAKFDELEAEIRQIDGHLKRLRVLETVAVTSAKEVRPITVSGADLAAARAPVQIKAPKPEPGIQFARFARCMILGKKLGISPMEIAQSEYGERDPAIVSMVSKAHQQAINSSHQKANISAVNTVTDSVLVGNEGGVADYVEFLRNQTIVGRFGQNGIPALRRVPFYYPVVVQATGATAYWTAEGSAKPMTKPTWTRSELTPLVVAGLAAVTLQALRFSSPGAESALRDDLTAAIVEAIDTAFIDPANAGTAGAKPASVTNGITGTAVSGGQNADAVRDDARAAMAVFVAAKNPLTTGVWIMSGSNALGLALLVNPLGQSEFPGLNVNGGTFMGLPVIISEAAGNTVTLVNAGDIYLADDGGVQVDMSDSASLQMVDNPTGTSTGTDPVEATLVSMFQTNSVAIRVERFINWARRRPTGIATITGATWGQGAS
jgi:HK97 family phage prohead protease